MPPSPTARRGHRFDGLAIVAFFLVSAALTTASASAGTDRAATAPEGRPPSFDLDGNGIDDDIGPGSEFPAWTFVHVREGGDKHEVARYLGTLGATVHKCYKYIDVISVEFPSYRTLKEAAGNEDVDVIELDRPQEVFLDVSAKAVRTVPSPTYSPNTAHDLGYHGEGMVVAVLDLGIDNEHPTFAGAFVAGLDLTQPESVAPRDGSYDPDDETNGHGTGVASIVVGRGEDGSHVGMAPMAGLIDIKLSDYNPAYSRMIVEAHEWCVDHKDTVWNDVYSGIDVISESTSAGEEGGAIEKAIEQTVASGIAFVMAAGNDAQKQGDATTWWPDEAIIAGGSDDRETVDRLDDIYWPEATYGPRDSDGDDDPYDELRPDVVAPAVNLSVAAHSKFSKVSGATGWTGASAGTSYATPHVSGIVTLMIQADPSLRPPEGWQRLRQMLHETAEPRGEPYDPSLSGKYSEHYGFGIVDAFKAVKAAIDHRESNKSPVITGMTVAPSEVAVGGTVDVAVTAMDPEGDPLTYTLTADGGVVIGSGPEWDWRAPDVEGTYTLTAMVKDLSGSSAERVSIVTVHEVVEPLSPDDTEPGTTPENRPPVVLSFTASGDEVETGGTVTLRTTASDPDGDLISYTYSATKGKVQGDGSTATFTAPTHACLAEVTVTATDPDQLSDEKTLEIIVKAAKMQEPPSIASVKVEPASITTGSGDAKVLLTATIGSPGAGIESVEADLSGMGGEDRARLHDDGGDGDLRAGDGTYSLVLSDLKDLQPDSYGIKVICVDVEGARSDARIVWLKVEDGPEVAGEGGKSPLGVDILLAAILIAAVISLARKTRELRSG